MKILVTGSRGNIGRHLVPYLESQNHDVFGADLVAGFQTNYLQANVLNPSDLEGVFADFKPEVVIHLAGMVSRVTCEAAMTMCYDANLMGTANVVGLCQRVGSRLVHFSTSEIYGNLDQEMIEDIPLPAPNNRYGLSKWLTEKIVAYETTQGNLQAVVVRPFMMYHEDETWGDHRSAMIRFCLAAKNKQPFEVHKGSERAWLHADDAVRIIEKCCHRNQGFEVFNMGSDEYVTTEDLAKRICVLFNCDYAVLAKEIDQPRRMTLKKRPSLKKMFADLQIKPQVTLDEGLRRIKAYLDAHPS